MRQRLIMGTVAAVFVTFPFATGGFGAGTDPASSSHRLDRLDAKRPGAASAPDVYQFQVEGVYEAAAMTSVFNTVSYVAAVARAEAAREAEAARQSEAARLAAARRPTRLPVVSSSDPGGFLSCVRSRESRGDYGVVSSGGQYHGAYQFLQSTWDSTAAHAGRPDLIGVDPAAASPADQDALAANLYSWQGASPWGGSC